jgi:hypothetical protein
MAKRVVREEGVFADPYEDVRGTVNDPAREHDPRLIRNSPDVGGGPRTTAIATAAAPVLSPPATSSRRKRRKQA